MKYVINADTNMVFTGNLLQISKGVWNCEETIIQLDEKERDYQKTSDILKALEEHKIIEIRNSDNESIKQIFQYLTENGFLEEIGEEIHEKIQKKQILLILSEEFEEIKPYTFFERIETVEINRLYKGMGIDEAMTLDTLDALDIEIICDKTNLNYDQYDEFAFLLKNPDVEKLKIISRIMTEVNKISSYFLLDNNLFFSFTCVPLESPCFNCFNLRLLARNSVLRKKQHILRKMYFPKAESIHNYGSSINLTLTLNLAIKILLQDINNGERSNVGDVIIWNIDTLEVSKERLYKVPFCEGC